MSWRVRGVIAVVAAVGLLAGCGRSPTSPSPATWPSAPVVIISRTSRSNYKRSRGPARRTAELSGSRGGRLVGRRRVARGRPFLVAEDRLELG
jgi:hypothetical protein